LHERIDFYAGLCCKNMESKFYSWMLLKMYINKKIICMVGSDGMHRTWTLHYQLESYGRSYNLKNTMNDHVSLMIYSLKQKWTCNPILFR
jgi:hypothetical protein